MSESEMNTRLQEAGKAMAESRGLKALNRFMAVLENFSMAHPEEGEAIFDILSQYGSDEEPF